MTNQRLNSEKNVVSRDGTQKKFTNNIDHIHIEKEWISERVCVCAPVLWLSVTGSMTSGDVTFTGCCTIPAQDDSYDGTLFTRKDMQQKVTTIVGTPVLVEHGDGEKDTHAVGKITGARIGDDDRLWINAVISRDTWKGIEVIHDMRQGKRNNLSLGMEYLFQKAPTWARMVGKNIREVSLTGNPDFPGTNICYMAPDSPKWTLQKSLLEEHWKHEKLKRDIHKRCGALQRVFEKAADAQPQPCHRKRFKAMTDSSASVPTTALMETSEEQEQEQEQEQDADVANQETSPKTDELEKQVAELQGMNAQLESHKNEAAQFMSEFMKDPAGWQRVMLEHKQKQDALRKEMLGQREKIKDLVIQDFASQGERAPEALMSALNKAPEGDLSIGAPLYKMITVAHANRKQSQTDFEKRFQTMKAEMAAKLTKSRQQIEALSKSTASLSKQQSYLDKMSSPGTNKAARSEAELGNADGSEARGKKKQKTQTDSASQSLQVRFAQAQPPRPVIPADFSVRGLRGRGAQDAQGMLTLFGSESVHIPEGMHTVTPEGFKRNNFGTPGSGVDPETGEIRDLTQLSATFGAE